jgi:hypothetical protein
MFAGCRGILADSRPEIVFPWFQRPNGTANLPHAHMFYGSKLTGTAK